MLVRYCTSAEGKPVKKAEIYTAEDHHIDPSLVDPDARRVVQKLRREGYKAYIVGGAVRDLITGLKPKDFDIATDALPRRVRRIFRNSRIIGRRFRIVHIYVEREGRRKILEVSTFRRRAADDARSETVKKKRKNGLNNVYGSIEEDVWRRDFTVNALYYCPLRQIIIDFVGGYRDIRERRIRTLAPATESFSEDPVRMIRGVKYAEFTGFPLPPAITAAMKKHRKELADCSPARLTEEVYKILASGFAAGVFLQAFRLKLLEVFLPSLDRCWRSMNRKRLAHNLRATMGVLDRRVREEPELEPSRGSMLAYLVRSNSEQWPSGESTEELAERIREAVVPLLPSRRECERAAALILRWRGRHAARERGRHAAR